MPGWLWKRFHTRGKGPVVTIHDVARRAGVGVGTVSRVLNGSPSVSDATRRHVEAVIDRLDYHPRKHARSLSLGRTQTLGVVVPFVTQLSAVERIRGVVQGIGGSGYDLILFDVETPAQRDELIHRSVRGGSVDGVLVVSLPPVGESGQVLAEARIPVVLVDCRHPALPSVVIDDRAGGRLATEALVALGHRRIAFVGTVDGAGFEFTSGAHRREGFLDVLAAAGIAVEPDLVVTDAPDQQAARRRVAELLALPAPPTAVFAASDELALGALGAARDAGVSVPERLSVIGFDDVELSAYARLSTIRQPLRTSGLRGAQLLLAALGSSGDDRSLDEELPLELVLRDSTGPPPDAPP